MSELHEDATKAIAWAAYREAWNEVSSMDSMTELDERTAKSAFDRWWQRQ